MKVFLITQGSYSDYHVCGVFSTREIAEQNLAIYNDEPQIEEWEVDVAVNHPPGTFPFKVEMEENGNGRVERASAEWLSEERFFSRGDGKMYYRVSVWARDEEHATKIANEKRTQLISSGAWKKTRTGRKPSIRPHNQHP